MNEKRRGQIRKELMGAGATPSQIDRELEIISRQEKENDNFM